MPHLAYGAIARATDDKKSAAFVEKGLTD